MDEKNELKQDVINAIVLMIHVRTVTHDVITVAVKCHGVHVVKCIQATVVFLTELVCVLNMIKFKAVTFVIGNDISHGHYFYEVTLPEAIEKMKAKGIDPLSLSNFKMNIAVYPW